MTTKTWWIKVEVKSGSKCFSVTRTSRQSLELDVFSYCTSWQLPGGSYLQMYSFSKGKAGKRSLLFIEKGDDWYCFSYWENTIFCTSIHTDHLNELDTTKFVQYFATLGFKYSSYILLFLRILLYLASHFDQLFVRVLLSSDFSL